MNAMCEACSELLQFVIKYEREANQIVSDHEDAEGVVLRWLKKSELQVICNFVSVSQPRLCNCLFRDVKNFDKLNIIVQGLLTTAIHLLKCILKSLSDPKDGCQRELLKDREKEKDKEKEKERERDKVKEKEKDREREEKEKLGKGKSEAGKAAKERKKKGKKKRTQGEDGEEDDEEEEKVVVDGSVDSRDSNEEEEDEDVEEEEDDDEDEDAEEDEADIDLDPEAEDEVMKWSLEEKEKLLHLVSKVFHSHFPFYAIHKHSLHQSRLDDLSQKEAALLSAYCDLSDSDIPILLLRNISYFCEHEAVDLLVECFAKASPDSLPLSLGHAIIAVIHHLKYGINVNTLMSKLVLLRTHVINYLCKVPDKDLRVPSNRNMFEFMWSVIKEPMDARCSIVDKEGLALALKYFTSSTLTMRLAGISQINNYISLFNEFSQSEGSMTQRQMDMIAEELVDWILANKIIEHIFGPNLHVEVIKQSLVVLNFIVSRLSAEHIDAIWSSSQLKHCSRQVLDILTQLIKNMNIQSVLHLYSLLRAFEPKEHTEQTLYLASCILKYIWTRSLNIPEPIPSLSGICDPKNGKPPIFTLLPAPSHDGDQSSTSASVDSNDEDDDTDFEMKREVPTHLNIRAPTPDSNSSCASRSSDEIPGQVTLVGKGPTVRPNCLKPRGLGQGLTLTPKRPGTTTDSEEEDDDDEDDDEEEQRGKPPGFVYGTCYRLALSSKPRKMDAISDDAKKDKEAYLKPKSKIGEDGADLLAKSRSEVSGQDVKQAGDVGTLSDNSSQVSHTSVKNMADFDGEDSDIDSRNAALLPKDTDFADISEILPKFHPNSAKSPFMTNDNEPSSISFNQQSPKTSDSKKSSSHSDQETDKGFEDSDLKQFTIDNVCRPGQTLLWDLLQDNAVCHLAEGLLHDCEKILCNLICWLADRRIRMKFIEGCLENLSHNRSVMISLRLLPKLLMSFQQYRGGQDIHKVTLWAENEHQMLSHFFSNLVLYSRRRGELTTGLYNHTEEIQTRLHFLSFVFSSSGSPEDFKLNREQVDILWTCIAKEDTECCDELFNWMLNQIRLRDHHALGSDMLRCILTEKMPQIAPEMFTMLALELLQHLCGYVLSNQVNEVAALAIKQLWDIALRAVNTDVSMAAIKHLNNYYIHLQNHPTSALEKEEEFIKQCMDFLMSSSQQLTDDEEKNLTIIQRALILLKTHLEVFRCRYSYHLRRMQLDGDTTVMSHRNKAGERSSQQILRVVCQPAAINEKTCFELHFSDYVGELRAEVSHWWESVARKLKAEHLTLTPNSQSSSSCEGPLRLLSQGQELTNDLDEKTLSEIGFKDMQLVYTSIGAHKPSRKVRDIIEPASALPPPAKNKLPSVLLLQPPYFEQLFSLTQQLGSTKGSSHIRAQVLSRRVWDIIQILPTSPELLNCFQSINSTNSQSQESSNNATQSTSLVFNDLLSPNSPQKLIYSVQIVEWLRRTSKNEDKSWSQEFVDCGGLRHLFDIFVSGVLHQNESESWNEWKQDCLASLLQLIYQFGINTLPKDAKVTSEAGSSALPQPHEPVPLETVSKKKRPRKGSVDKLLVHQFNAKLLGMLEDVDSMLRVLLAILNEATSRPADTNCYQTGFWGRAQVVHHTLIFLTSWAFSDPQIRSSLFGSPNVSAILKRLVLDDPDPSMRREACSGFYRMCLGFTSSQKTGLIFIPQLLNSLLSFLAVAQTMRAPKASEHEEIAFIEKEPYGPGCKDYFWLVCRLVDSLEDEEERVDLDRLCNYMAEAIVTREIRENRKSNAEDEGLRGLLALMTVSLKHSPPFKHSDEGRKFMVEVFEALFRLPNQNERNLPKCKVQSTRSTAFDLLVELVKGSEENHVALMKMLSEQHSPTSHAPYPWDFWPHDDCRSECGYVGLINLGATCYMASCLQHLFMFPETRYAILSANVTKETKHESILYELQRMFAFLLESERKAYNPRSFCKLYNMYTLQLRPLNTGEQLDMNELFTDLISKFEEMTSELKDTVKSLFGGTLSNNVVSLDCPHISRTTEEFYTLRCKVADMRHLWDSLDELTVKDTLEGDNMYTCSQCGRKVRAEKRTCIKQLPRILCFNTLRYTYNLLTMTREKINTHHSFPMRLDMTPYLEENLIRGDKSEKQSGSKETLESNEYELIGVTVHTGGTADGGHFYCFIREPENAKEKDKWYMFNDAEVKPFDPSQIGAECFGGEMTSKTYDSVTDKFMDFSFEKTNGAYMLFYERITKKEPQAKNAKDEVTSIATELEQSTSTFELSSELSAWIWEDNMQFLRDKSIFEHTYFDFMWQVCGYIPQTLSNSPKVLLHSTQLATSFVLETLIHSKEKPTIANWIELLTKQFNASPAACEWLMDHLAEDCHWPIQILLKCPNQMVRQLFQRLCIHVITQLRPSQAPLYLQPLAEFGEDFSEDPEVLSHVGEFSCVTRFVRKLLSLTKFNNIVKPHPKHLTEYFAFLYEFAKMGEEECRFLLATEAITTIVHFYLNHCKGGNDYVEMMSDDEDEEEEEVNPLPSGFHSLQGCRALHAPHINLGEEKYPKPASLDKMITLVAYLVEKSRAADNRLRLSVNDFEIVFGGKGFPFLQRQIRDNINLRQTFNLICSLCRFNETAATPIINMLMNSINRQPESSSPFFRVLSMLVEVLSEPPGMPSFSTFIYPRIWEIAEHTPQHCLEWLTVQVPRNKVAHTLVLQSMDNWVEYFLLSHNIQRVRNSAALLLISLVPNNSFRQCYSKSPRTLLMQKDNMELNNEAVLIIQQIFSCLLNLLKRAKIYADPQTHGTAKLTSYFAVMVYCLVSNHEKLMLVPHFMDLWSLFQPKLSEPAIAVNHNKQTLLYFWFQACTECPDNVRCIVQNPVVIKNIAFNYILADHDDQEVIIFNRMMLPSYYGLLRLCCSQSRSFTRQLSLHQNIQWAFKNITPFMTQYQAAVGELFKLMKQFVAVSAETTEQELRDIRQFKRTTITMYLTAVDPRSCWATLISALGILVESEDDRAFVILNSGLLYLLQSFNTLFMMFHEATACHITNEIVELLKVIADLLRTLKTSSLTEVRDWIPKWKEHSEIIRKLILLLNTYTPAQVRLACMTVLQELIQIYPKDCVPVLVQSLGLGHLTFQDQYVNFSAGPYFPRKGQRMLLTKSSLRPPRPVFQMHFHPKMLEINFRTDADYDKLVIEYFYPYYQFIATICRTAVSHRLVNQELVGLCSMVALESLVLHLPLFPRLWLDFHQSPDEGSKEFVHLLCTTCNNFRDYIYVVLTQERSLLRDDNVFQALKEFIPKVRSLTVTPQMLSQMVSLMKDFSEQSDKLDLEKDGWRLTADFRAFYLILTCDKSVPITAEFKAALAQFKERVAAFLARDRNVSPENETPQKRRKTKQEVPFEESDTENCSMEESDAATNENEWRQRLESSVADLVLLLKS